MSSLFDTDDDISLRTRRGAEDRSRERSVEMADHSPADREVTLNTGTVLALFFALALICAVFFGFGYSMGRKSTQAPVTAANSTTTDSSADDTASTSHNAASDKPAPGSPAIQAVPGYMSQQEANDANSKSTQSVAAAPVRTPAVPAPARTAVAATPPTAAPVVRTTPPPAPVAAPVTAAAAAPGSVYVQIAAVSHQEDADVLKSALGRRGYKVVERSDANDRLIHVQIGPFTDRKAAEATRQKLLSDGYNAFLK